MTKWRSGIRVLFPCVVFYRATLRKRDICYCHVSVCMSICYKPVLYRNDWTNRAGFWHGGFLPSIPHYVVRKFAYLQKLRYFPLALCPKLRTWKILPRQVDRVVNKTLRRRRRRRSSLLTTPIRRSTSRGCLLQVGQL